MRMETALDGIESKIETLKKARGTSTPQFIEGLNHLIASLDTLLDASSQASNIDNSYIQIYDTIRLETGEILRASEDYQGKEWFSNIAITPASDQSHYKSAEGAWYAKVCNSKKSVISLP